MKKKPIKKTPKDDRTTLKFDKEFYSLISSEIGGHPEWGVRSVPDFVRRAVDNELNARKKLADRKTIEITLKSHASPEGNPDKRPRKPTA